jgi:hypothetical protein
MPQFPRHPSALNLVQPLGFSQIDTTLYVYCLMLCALIFCTRPCTVPPVLCIPAVHCVYTTYMPLSRDQSPMHT